MPDTIPRKPFRTTGGGYFALPTGPAAGTTVATSGSANTFGAFVEFSADPGADIYIVGVVAVGSGPGLYTRIDIATGAATSESSVGEAHMEGTTAAGERLPAYFPFPIPVANGTRIAVRAADEDAAAQNALITLICINQADVIGF